MNVLVLGSGGREHALAWRLSQGDDVKLYIAPGNAGTALLGENVPLSPSDFEGVKAFCLSHSIDLVVVGPEQPLVDGVVDFFKNDEELSSVGIVGPDSKGAKLEGSKAFAKEFMCRYGVPTARCLTVDKNTIEQGKHFLEQLKAPYVLKADGLAAGKGVLIIDTLQEAQQELENMLSGKFGAASAVVVIEEFLKGIEVSMFVLTDGKDFVLLPEAKDYKRIGDGDIGLNTGGMGAVSPVPFVDDDFVAKVKDRIIKPTLEGIRNENIDYKGFIFIGLMNVEGDPYVIEYNVRMGDPETEAVMTRIKGDFAALLMACSQGRLSSVLCDIDTRTAVTVVMVSGGYPESYAKGKLISGLDDDMQSIVFHAGTSKNAEGDIITSGGRVLAVTSLGNTIEEARARAYDDVCKITFDGEYHRTDIGLDLMKYL